jgi:abortive infection bacteriophage resistance protein
MSKQIDEYKKNYRDWQHNKFLKMMGELMKRYKDDVLTKKDEKDRDFQLWHIIKDAYDEGRNDGDKYFRDLIFDLTNAEEYFRDLVRSEI